MYNNTDNKDLHYYSTRLTATIQNIQTESQMDQIHKHEPNGSLKK